jgi:hypothetical protein
MPWNISDTRAFSCLQLMGRPGWVGDNSQYLGCPGQTGVWGEEQEGEKKWLRAKRTKTEQDSREGGNDAGQS